MLIYENEEHENVLNGIGTYLKVVKTPARKGIKNVERKSFIISSSPYQKDIKSQIEKKVMSDQLKEDRKIEKLQKKELKEQTLKENRKRKTEKLHKIQTKHVKNPKIKCEKVKKSKPPVRENPISHTFG